MYGAQCNVWLQPFPGVQTISTRCLALGESSWIKVKNGDFKLSSQTRSAFGGTSHGSETSTIKPNLRPNIERCTHCGPGGTVKVWQDCLVQRQKVESIFSEGIFSCNLCGNKFQDTVYLKNHIMNSHALVNSCYIVICNLSILAVRCFLFGTEEFRCNMFHSLSM